MDWQYISINTHKGTIARFQHNLGDGAVAWISGGLQIITANTMIVLWCTKSLQEKVVFSSPSIVDKIAVSSAAAGRHVTVLEI